MFSLLDDDVMSTISCYWQQVLTVEFTCYSHSVLSKASSREQYCCYGEIMDYI